MFRQLFFSVVLGLALVCPAAAQARSDDPRTKTQLHFGPAYLDPSVSLQDLGIDTNVFDQPEAPSRDFTFTVRPKLVTSVPIARRGLFQVSTASDVVYYQRFQTERSFNPILSARGEVYFNKLTLFVQPSYLRTRQRPNYEIDARLRRVEEGTEGGAEVDLTPKIAVNLSVKQARTIFDADETFLGTSLSQSLNRNSWTYSAGGKWAITPLTTIIIKSDQTKDKFLLSPIRNTEGQKFVGGLELKPRALIAGSVSAGIRRFRPSDTRVPNFLGLTASAGLSYTLKGATIFAVSIDRDTSYSFEPSEPYYVATGRGFSVRRHLSGKFDVSGGYDKYTYAYRSVTPVAASVEHHRLDQTVVYSASVGYRVGRTGRFALGWSSRERTSTESRFRNYTAARIGAAFTYGT